MDNKTVTQEEIANVIPKGHKNAITLEQLVSIFENQGWLDGISDKSRATRKMIERTGYEYVICNLQDGHGYFRPTANDITAFRKWIIQEESRLSKISMRLKIGRNLFEDFIKDRLKEQKINE